MPICKSTLRALSSPRSPLHFSISKTVAPFLYQTATIQQWKSAVYRNASSRSSPDDDIPFEDDSLPPKIEDAKRSRKTTITGVEHAAFRKLYDKYNVNNTKKSKPSNDVIFSDESDQIADEYYEDEEDAKDSSVSLDSVFDAVLAGLPRSVKGDTQKSRKPTENLKTLAESILEPEAQEVKKVSKESKEKIAAEAERIRALQSKDKLRVTALLKKAQTDHELWEVLEKEVLEKMRALDLDESRKQKQPKVQTSPTEPEPSDNASPDPKVLCANFPYHLVTCARTLRTKFPASQLPLNILPTVKSLGRSYYALGATTSLYNILIHTAWVQHSSYDRIDELLADMDNGCIEFNSRTLILLNEIILEYEDAMKSEYGNSMKMVWQMEHFWDGARKLKSWRMVAKERIVARLERRRKVRKILHSSPEKKAAAVRNEMEMKRMKRAIADAEVWDPVLV